jgi:hypothetical protein
MYDNFNFPEVENEPIVNFLEEIILEKYYYKKSLVVYDKIETAITKHISEICFVSI